EYRHVIDNPQRREYLGTLISAEHGPIWPLQFTHSPVAIYRHDERVAERARLCQVTNMPDVQQIKNSIRKHESPACRAQTLPLGEHCPPGQNFLDHGKRLQDCGMSV